MEKATQLGGKRERKVGRRGPSARSSSSPRPRSSRPRPFLPAPASKASRILSSRISPSKRAPHSIAGSAGNCPTAGPCWRRCPQDHQPFRTRAETLRARPISSGQNTIPRLLDLLAGFGISISKRQLVRLLIEARRFSRRSTRCVAHWPASGVLDHGRRYRRAAQGSEWRVHADRQRPVHVIHDHRFQEPAELSRTAECGRLHASDQ